MTEQSSKEKQTTPREGFEVMHMFSLKKLFIKSNAPNPAEKTLRELGCAFQKKKDGTLVTLNIDLSNKNLAELPDLSSVIVDWNFYCNGNQLTSLKGAPRSVRGGVFCDRNRLNTLVDMPQDCILIRSDFGTFSSWEDVPEQFRLSPETKARLEQERERSYTEGATVLQRGMKAGGPLQLRRRP